MLQDLKCNIFKTKFIGIGPNLFFFIIILANNPTLYPAAQSQNPHFTFCINSSFINSTKWDKVSWVRHSPWAQNLMKCQNFSNQDKQYSSLTFNPPFARISYWKIIIWQSFLCSKSFCSSSLFSPDNVLILKLLKELELSLTGFCLFLNFPHLCARRSESF